VTHTPVPPPPVLSRDGSVVAVAAGSMLVRASVADGRRSSLELPHAASIGALGTNGERAIVGGARALTLCADAVLRTIEIEGVVLRVALDGDLTAALARDGARTMLHTWQGDALDPLGEPLDLGELAPDGLAADGTRRRILAWGTAGPLAALGEGDLAVALVEIGADGLHLVWSGEEGPDDPNGFLFPLAAGAVGSYSRDELVVLAPANGGWEPTSRVQLADAESAAASPDGSWIAWSFSRYDEPAEQDVGQIRVARLPGGALERTLTTPARGAFEALAVDDAGTVTLATTRPPGTLTVGVAERGALTQRLELSV
jgi:hypothetical protein